MVLRSASGLTLPTRPAIALIGPRADDFRTVRVSLGDTVVLESALDGHLFRWPATAAPLSPATAYKLELLPAAAGAAPLSMKFVTPRASAAAPDENVTLITIE